MQLIRWATSRQLGAICTANRQAASRALTKPINWWSLKSCARSFLNSTEAIGRDSGRSSLRIFGSFSHQKRTIMSELFPNLRQVLERRLVFRRKPNTKCNPFPGIRRIQNPLLNAVEALTGYQRPDHFDPASNIDSNFEWEVASFGWDRIRG